MKIPTTSRSRRLPLLAAAALLTLTVAGCGSEDDGETTATDESSSESSAPTETEAAPETEVAPETESEAPPASGTETGDVLPEWAPEIVTEGDLVTGLDFTDTPEPTDELLVATVTEGDGPPVEVGQNITANYFGSVYGSDTPFDESFSGSPFTAPIGVGQLIAGWDEKIPGVPVGSRIIMSIPAEQGYGDMDQPGIPAGSTLFFVIDILDAA